MNKYTVKKGDSLSLIAKRNNMTLSQIIKLNPKFKDNPSLIRSGDTVKINSSNNTGSKSYTVKSGDTLSAIAKANNTTVAEIQRNNGIDDPRKLQVGTKLKFNTESNDNGLVTPQSNTSEIDAADSTAVRNLQTMLKNEGLLTKVDSIYGKNTQAALEAYLDKKGIPRDSIKVNTKRDRFAKDEEFVKSSNKKNSLNVINNHYKKNKGRYIVVDKKANTMSVYDEGNIIKTYKVGLGTNAGSDKITGTGGEKGFTGAGKFTISNKSLANNASQEEHFNKLYEGNLLSLENESGLLQGMAIHQVPKGNKGRVKKLKDSNPNNDDFSWGCINCTKEDFESFQEYTKEGMEVYVLPEEKENFFESRNNKVNFTRSTNDNAKDYNLTYTATNSYNSPKVQQDSYKSTTYSLGEDANDISKEFMGELASRKRELMQELQLDNDTYDKLATQAYGILGAETDFGKRKLTRNPLTSMYNEELYMDIAEAFGSNQDNKSSGLTQIRVNNIPKNIRDKYEINRDNLSNPGKSAIATMAMLKGYSEEAIANRHNIKNMSRDNYLDFSPYGHFTGDALQTGKREGLDLDPYNNTYTKKVLDYSNQVEVGSFKYGGKMKKRKLPKYKLGSDAGLNKANPLLDPSIVTAAMSGVTDVLQAINTPKPDPTMLTPIGGRSFKLGGKINKLAAYKGAKHSQGGIDIDNNMKPTNTKPVAEVEGGETSYGDYIYSNAMKVDGKNTFADKSKKINRKYGKADDALSIRTKETELARLAEKNNIARQQVEQEQMNKKLKWGGKKPEYILGGNPLTGLEGIIGDPNKKTYSTLADRPNNYSYAVDDAEYDPLKIDFSNVKMTDSLPGADPMIANQFTNSYSGVPVQNGTEATDANGNLLPQSSNVDTNVPNYNKLAYASLMPMLGRTLKDLTGTPDKTALTLADYGPARSRFDGMNADLTQARQDTRGAFNQAQEQINESSNTSGGLRNARLQGANSSYRDSIGQIATSQQGLRNNIKATQGQAEANFAGDTANRITRNITDNEQNKAVTEDISRQASQSLYNIVGKNANNRQMFEDIKSNNLTLNQASSAEGYKFLETIAMNFGMGGSEELKNFQANPNDPAAFKAFMDAFQIKFKGGTTPN